MGEWRSVELKAKGRERHEERGKIMDRERKRIRGERRERKMEGMHWEEERRYDSRDSVVVGTALKPSIDDLVRYRRLPPKRSHGRFSDWTLQRHDDDDDDLQEEKEKEEEQKQGGRGK